MSVPARRLGAPGARPATRPAARPLPSTPPQRSRGARRGSHLGFWIFSTVVVTALVMSVVALHALLVQTEYGIRSAGQQASTLQTQHQALVKDVAQLSSPARVASWARGHGMVTPSSVIFVRTGGGSGHSRTEGGG